METEYSDVQGFCALCPNLLDDGRDLVGQLWVCSSCAAKLVEEARETEVRAAQQAQYFEKLQELRAQGDNVNGISLVKRLGYLRFLVEGDPPYGSVYKRETKGMYDVNSTLRELDKAKCTCSTCLAGATS